MKHFHVYRNLPCHKIMVGARRFGKVFVAHLRLPHTLYSFQINIPKMLKKYFSKGALSKDVLLEKMILEELRKKEG